jgi:hypothetical protein
MGSAAAAVVVVGVVKMLARQQGPASFPPPVGKLGHRSYFRINNNNNIYINRL